MISDNYQLAGCVPGTYMFLWYTSVSIYLAAVYLADYIFSFTVEQ